MSSHLPYVVPGEIVPGPLYFIPRQGYTSKPISIAPIQEANAAVPDIFRQKAEAAGQARLKDDNLVKVIQQALQKQTASSSQSMTTDKQAQPSNLSWRG